MKKLFDPLHIIYMNISLFMISILDIHWGACFINDDLGYSYVPCHFLHLLFFQLLLHRLVEHNVEQQLHHREQHS